MIFSRLKFLPRNDACNKWSSRQAHVSFMCSRHRSVSSGCRDMLITSASVQDSRFAESIMLENLRMHRVLSIYSKSLGKNLRGRWMHNNDTEFQDTMLNRLLHSSNYHYVDCVPHYEIFVL
ncbi:hypothetical protein AcV7_005762 [Taiwanofungus camphoratus]|nr:hypothetical protein AcV7_005762 [Antrodia cinnamomea]